MREESQPESRAGSESPDLRRAGLERAGADLQRRFPVALVLYGILAVLVWFTMDAGKFMVMGRPVELRLIPLIIIGGLALRTVLARQADKIRRGGKEGS